jgi:hypothetical protein
MEQNKMMNKKGEISPLWIVAIAVAAILILNVGGSQDWAKGMLDKVGTQAVNDVPVSAGQASKCYIEDTTVTVGPAQQRYKPTTKATSSYHQVFKNGVDKGAYLDGSTLTANPGDKLEIYYAYNDSQAANAGYYASKQVFTVPCVGEVTTAEAPDSDAYQLFKSDANNLTKQVFNWNNGNLNSLTADNMSLTAGDKKTNTMKLFGSYQNGFSPYGKIATVVSVNSTTYQNIVIGDYPKITAPTHYRYPAHFGQEVYTYAFELPGIRSNEELDTTLYVEVKTTPGDATVLPSEGNAISIFFIDQDWFQHTIDGNMVYGYEDNDYGDVGMPDFNITVYVK